MDSGNIYKIRETVRKTNFLGGQADIRIKYLIFCNAKSLTRCLNRANKANKFSYMKHCGEIRQGQNFVSHLLRERLGMDKFTQESAAKENGQEEVHKPHL